MKKVFRTKNHLAHVRLDQEPYFQAGEAMGKNKKQPKELLSWL